MVISEYKSHESRTRLALIGCRLESSVVFQASSLLEALRMHVHHLFHHLRFSQPFSKIHHLRGFHVFRFMVR